MLDVHMIICLNSYMIWASNHIWLSYMMVHQHDQIFKSYVAKSYMVSYMNHACQIICLFLKLSNHMSPNHMWCHIWSSHIISCCLLFGLYQSFKSYVAKSYTVSYIVIPYYLLLSTFWVISVFQIICLQIIYGLIYDDPMWSSYVYFVRCIIVWNHMPPNYCFRTYKLNHFIN